MRYPDVLNELRYSTVYKNMYYKWNSNSIFFIHRDDHYFFVNTSFRPRGKREFFHLCSLSVIADYTG